MDLYPLPRKAPTWGFASGHRPTRTFQYPPTMGVEVRIVPAVETALGRSLGAARVETMPGGHSWDTYLVSTASGPEAVVRVAPRGGTLDPYDVEVERRALRAARGALPAPDVLLVAAHPSEFGAPLQVQTVAPGARLRSSQEIPLHERKRYRAAMAVALGDLHRLGDPSRLSAVKTTGEAIRSIIDVEVEHYLRAAAARQPGFEIGLRWLLSNLPGGSDEPVVCHGDYRIGNILWDDGGEISAVLDWERAWAGDPMCDIAFTRQFSAWGGIDGEAVALYERASGRRVDESLMTFYLRLERWRSYTASMRGISALASGNSDRVALAAIGEAGNSGMWDLASWLEDGLVPLPPGLAQRPSHYAPTLSASRRIEIARHPGTGGRLRSHLLDDEEAGRALRRSVDRLRTIGGMPALAKAVDLSDLEAAWEAAFEVLTVAAADGGRNLRAALQALGLRFTGRPTFLQEMAWR